MTKIDEAINIAFAFIASVFVVWSVAVNLFLNANHWDHDTMQYLNLSKKKGDSQEGGQNKDNRSFGVVKLFINGIDRSCTNAAN